MDRSGITLPRPNAREALLRACPDYRGESILSKALAAFRALLKERVLSV